MRRIRSVIPFQFVPQPDSVTCQAACIAMAIGVGSDEVQNIRARLLELGTAGDPYVMGKALSAELGERYHFNDNASLLDARSHLEAGCLLITHGWFTRSGHVIVIDGVTIDSNNLSYKFHVRDPWTEFDFPAWEYRSKKIGFEGYYSSFGIYASCVAGQSPSSAFALYRRGELDSARKGMWLHVIKPT